MKEYSISETAKILGVSRQHIFRLIKKGDLKARRALEFGHQPWLISEKEIQKRKDKINKKENKNNYSNCIK